MSETAVMTLTDFLLARIAEDEAAANEARGLQDYMPSGAWDLDRVLAECEAKRRIVGIHPAPSYIDDPDARLACDRCSHLEGPYGYDDPENWVDWPCPTLRALALPYADHPDYDEAWRP